MPCSKCHKHRGQARRFVCLHDSDHFLALRRNINDKVVLNADSCNIQRQEGHLCGWTVSPEQTQIYPITNPGAQCDLEEQLLPHAIDKNGHLVYQFDRCFDDTASTKEIFEWIAKPLIEPLLNGVNGSILTYGQTGSGKTHSIFGTFKDAGLIELAARGSRTQTPNAGREIHDRPGTIFTVKVSYIEIYMERVNDLLQDGQRGNKYQAENLPVKEDPFKGFYVQGMHEQEVETVSDVLHTLQQADRKRRFARTDFNAMSSRSHVIFSIIVESFTPVDTSLKNARGTEAVGIWRTARLSLVDLAGSERLAIRRRPYTSARLSSQPDLQARSTLGGNANVALLVTLHPSHKYADVTHNSLKFAQRVGCLRVHAQTNCHTTKEHSVILRQRKIIEQLRAELQNSQKQV
ncbi:kinesin motor domain-containing protein [Toxoplasma gondii GT1]|nr:kinesin motor domain-containing protein [Toxoplasma gondii GT1]KAF4641990.1 kinesin motor domain-containing protein [Toxoplasma gondii]